MKNEIFVDFTKKKMKKSMIGNISKTAKLISTKLGKEKP